MQKSFNPKSTPQLFLVFVKDLISTSVEMLAKYFPLAVLEIVILLILVKPLKLVLFLNLIQPTLGILIFLLS